MTKPLISIFVFQILLGFFLAFQPSQSLSQTNQTSKIKIGILEFAKGQHPQEMDSLFSSIQKNELLECERVVIHKKFKARDLDKFQVIWIHLTDTTIAIENILPKHDLQSLKTWCEKGGKLLLTLKALELLPELGLENQKPQKHVAEAKDEGYGRKLGLHALYSHPVFKEMHGGAYIFQPDKDTTTIQYGYFGEKMIPQGKVIAVDWAYIHLHENSKIVLEYELGKGKILAIGAYTLFSTSNTHKTDLESFISNSILYLLDANPSEAYFWNYAPNTVQYQEFDAPEINLWSPATWNLDKSYMFAQKKSSNDFWDLPGQQILLMGKENGGIEEIWAHPFMALRDYEVGIRKNPTDSVLWLSSVQNSIEIAPAWLLRVYHVDGIVFKEFLTADIESPVALMHYEWEGTDSLEVFVRFKSRLRMMWPYSSHVTGQISYSWNKNLNALVFKDQLDKMSVVGGSNVVPFSKKLGNYSEINPYTLQSIDAPKGDLLLAGLLHFKLKNQQILELQWAAGSAGVEKTIELYATNAKQTDEILTHAQQYYQLANKNLLSITTPDTLFNKYFRWAATSAGQFFVHTPGIGKSLVAGYATSARGWDGNHEINGRPGYAWYFGRDGIWSGFALNDLGDFEKVKSILEQFIKFQHESGKIYHELTTSGVAHYDAADATPLFVVLAGQYFRYSADSIFIQKNWPAIKKAMDFCESTDVDQDHLINNTLVGHGWVEGGHLFGGQTTIYLASVWAAALKEAEIMAKNLKLTNLANHYNLERQLVENKINTDFWNSETHHFNHSLNSDGSYIEDITIMPSIPLYYRQIKEPKKAGDVLKKLSSNNFTADWGVRITGMDSPRFNPAGYHTGSVWPLYTGWVALAEYKNQRPCQGFSHLYQNLSNGNDWSMGHREEVIHGLQYRPSGVCAHQCWSETMAIQPAIEGLLGLDVNATEHQLTLEPAFPAHWDSINVSNIPFAHQKLHLKMKRNAAHCEITFTNNADKQGINVSFNPYLESGSHVKSVWLNEQPLEFSVVENNENIQLLTSFVLNETCHLVIDYERGIEWIPVVYSVKPNDFSKGIRIISSAFKPNEYSLELEGLSGSEYSLYLSTGIYSVESAEGAEISESNGKLLKINISFPQDSQRQGYKRHTVKLKLH